MYIKIASIISKSHLLHLKTCCSSIISVVRRLAFVIQSRIIKLYPNKNNNMKKVTLIMIVLMTFLAIACKKDGDNISLKNNDINISEYIVVGETFWGYDVNKTPPYIIEFATNGKANIYTLEAQITTEYETKGNRIILANIGYIDVEDGLTKNTLAGIDVDLKDGKLIKLQQLENKTYPKGQRMIWKFDGTSTNTNIVKDYQIIVSGNKIIEKYLRNTLYNDLWGQVTNEYTFTKLLGNGGYYNKDGRKIIFYIDPIQNNLIYWDYASYSYVYYKY
jgi:hypothetical protein